MSEVDHPTMPHLDDPENKEKGRAGSQARIAALNKLIDNHRAEFEEILATERTSRGLSPKPIKAGWVTIDELKARIERHEKKKQKWEQMIKDREREGLG